MALKVICTANPAFALVAADIRDGSVTRFLSLSDTLASRVFVILLYLYHYTRKDNSSKDCSYLNLVKYLKGVGNVIKLPKKIK